MQILVVKLYLTKLNTRIYASQRFAVVPSQDRALAQAVSRWLPAAAARVQTRL
jgi:hypothetical protein